MAARKKAVDATQDDLGVEPGEEEAIPSTEEESSGPVPSDDGEDSESEKPFRSREERAEYFQELQSLKEQNEFLSSQLERAIGALGSGKSEPERNGDAPSDELDPDQLNQLARTDPGKAIELVAEKKVQNLLAKHKAQEKKQSAVQGATDRLLSKYEEFNDPNDPFSKEVDRVYQRMSREQGYAPSEHSLEWAHQLRAAAAEVEMESPNLRKKNRPSTREKLRDRTVKETPMVSMPTSRSAPRATESDLPEWTEKDEAYARKCGLTDADGKVPERIKKGILRSRGQVSEGRHPNPTRDIDLRP